jgi:hypothetical protein
MVTVATGLARQCIKTVMACVQKKAVRMDGFAAAKSYRQMPTVDQPFTQTTCRKVCTTSTRSLCAAMTASIDL